MRIRFLPILGILLVLSGCASEQVVEKTPELYWPLPPEKPRIKFVDIILGSLDAEGRFEKIKQTFFGSISDRQFRKPQGIAARSNAVFVTDVGGIHYFNFAKGEFKIIGIGELRSPSAVGVSRDKLYIADAVRKKIFVFDFEGTPVAEFGSGEIETPAGIAVDEERSRVIISDARKHKIFVYGLDGRLKYSFGKKGAGEGEFYTPYGVAVDKEGRVYVVDSMNFRLQIFDEAGKFIKSFGKVGAMPGEFTRPKGVALDSEGHIYVLDSAFGNFQIFDYDGNVLLAVGAPGKEIAEFLLPSGIAIDEKDEIYVVDQLNRRVQIFKYLKEN